MLRRHRQMKKLRRVARMLLELEPNAQRVPREPRIRHRSRAVLGRS